MKDNKSWIDKMKNVLNVGVEQRLINHSVSGGIHPLTYIAMFSDFKKYKIAILDSDGTQAHQLPDAIRTVIVLGTMSLLSDLGFVSDKDLYDVENVEEEELDAVLNGCSDPNEVRH